MSHIITTVIVIVIGLYNTEKNIKDSGTNDVI